MTITLVIIFGWLLATTVLVVSSFTKPVEADRLERFEKVLSAEEA